MWLEICRTCVEQCVVCKIDRMLRHEFRNSCYITNRVNKTAEDTPIVSQVITIGVIKTQLQSLNISYTDPRWTTTDDYILNSTASKFKSRWPVNSYANLKSNSLLFEEHGNDNYICGWLYVRNSDKCDLFDCLGFERQEVIASNSLRKETQIFSVPKNWPQFWKKWVNNKTLISPFLKRTAKACICHSKNILKIKTLFGKSLC